METITRASARPCFPSPKLECPPPPGHGLLPPGRVLLHLTGRPSPSVSQPFSQGDSVSSTEPAPRWKEADVHHYSGGGRALAVHAALSALVSSAQGRRPAWLGQGCGLEVLALQDPQAPLHLARYRLGHGSGRLPDPQTPSSRWEGVSWTPQAISSRQGG